MNTVITLIPTEQLLALTQEMLVSAQVGEWEKLAELEKTRLPILNQVFAKGITDNAELAREVLSIDDKTKNLAIAEMPVIQDELQRLKNSGTASAAYQAIQSFTPVNK